MSDRSVAAFDKPVSNLRAPELIVERILEVLTAGELKAGDRLPDEAQLAKSFGVARMTLRNALVVLRELGLVTTARGRFGGTYVAPDFRERLRDMASERTVSAEALRSLTDWRRAISGEACFLAARRATRTQIAAILDAARGFEECIQDADVRRAADSRLHVLIAEASGSRHLVDQERSIQEEFNVVHASLPIIQHAFTETRSMDHDPLLHALQSRDAEGARAEMIAHIESTYAWWCSLLGVKRVA